MTQKSRAVGVQRGNLVPGKELSSGVRQALREIHACRVIAAKVS